MRRKEYACPNGCSLPPRRKQLREYSNGTYGFDFYDFTFCPCCGSLMPYSLKKLKGFFEVYNIHAALSDAVQLIYKSEFESAAREAFVAVENYLKKKSGLDSHGFDLATRALSFEIDKQTGEIKRAPLIAINDLKNESERNEQDGIRYMLMGFFQGPRNLYQHNHVGSGVSNSISVIIEASFFLHLLDGHSITQNGRWIPETVDYEAQFIEGWQQCSDDFYKVLKESRITFFLSSFVSLVAIPFVGQLLSPHIGQEFTSAIQAGAPLLNIGIGYFDYRNKISPAKADGGFSYIIKANRDGIIHI